MYEDLVKRLRSYNGWALNETLDQAADAIEELTAQTRWIPVTERLPVNTKSVLIVHRGGVSTGWYNGRYWERGASTNHRPIQTITHWRPLPEPPKEGE